MAVKPFTKKTQNGIVKTVKRVYPRAEELMIVSIQPPEKCGLSRCKKQYQISFRYYLKSDPKKKQKKKTVYFGKIGEPNYIDHKDS